MTRILVTAVSKHGATAEIAEILAANGLDPAVVPPTGTRSTSPRSSP